MLFQNFTSALTGTRLPAVRSAGEPGPPHVPHSVMPFAAILSRERRVGILVAPCVTTLQREFGSPLFVTVETPAHRQRRVLTDASHRFDRTVTRRAAHAARDVLAVIEVDEVRKVVNLDPRDWLAPLNGLFELLDLDGLRAQDPMTVHAHVERGDPRVPARSRAEMAVEAGDLRVPRMQLLPGRDRLLWRVTPVRAYARQLLRDEAARRNPSRTTL